MTLLRFDMRLCNDTRVHTHENRANERIRIVGFCQCGKSTAGLDANSIRNSIHLKVISTLQS